MIDPLEFARVLRSGIYGAEHSPQAAASIITVLAAECQNLRARVEELERSSLSDGARGPLVNAFARGFRSCQHELCRVVPPGSAAEGQILAMRPDPVAAFAAADEMRTR